MDLQGSFDVLSTVIERYESSDRSVRDVEAVAGDGELVVELDVAVEFCSSAESAPVPRTATLSERGALRVEFDPPGLPDLPANLTQCVTANRQGVTVVDDRLVRTIELTIAPDRATDRTGVAAHTECGGSGQGTPDAERADGTGGDGAGDPGDEDESVDTNVPDRDRSEGRPAAVRDESVPPYEDVAYLERLYEDSDTFVEMSRRIDMDVSSETVRRYMIEAGVHSPTTYNGTAQTGDGSDTPAPQAETAESQTETVETHVSESGTDPRETLPDEQLVTDGAGLPADIQVTDVVDAVVGSTTVYEVHQHLGVDQTRTRDLLSQLNLLDLVMGRVADASQRQITEDVVATRLRESATAEH